MKSYCETDSICRELTVFECGKEECINTKTIALTVKNYHLFHYVYSGKGTLILNGQKYLISKNTIFYIPPLTDAVYFADNETPWSYDWVGFGGEAADKCLQLLNIDINNPIIFDGDKEYKTYFDKVVYRYTSNGNIDLVSVGAMYALFGQMLFNKNGRQEVVTNKITIQLAKDFIHNNYQFDISINDVAKNAHVTPNYLSSVFQKEEGMSTKSYLIKVRMEKALVLLKTKQFKIKEITKMVGYSNQLHFSNEFRRYYGKSPTSYLVEEINK